MMASLLFRSRNEECLRCYNTGVHIKHILCQANGLLAHQMYVHIIRTISLCKDAPGGRLLLSKHLHLSLRTCIRNWFMVSVHELFTLPGKTVKGNAILDRVSFKSLINEDRN